MLAARLIRKPLALAGRLAAGVLLFAPFAHAQTPPSHVPRPTLRPDAEGYCQNTEFIGWSRDGAEAAYAESYCRQPPPDAAYDTLYRVTRDGRIKSWLIGAEAGADMKADTRARLLYGDVLRKAGAAAPQGHLTARAAIDGDQLVVSFVAGKKAKGVTAPEPVSRPIQLPYPGWELAKAPTVAAIHWSPDGGALAVTVKAVRKEPGGGRLPVAGVHFIEIAPLARPTNANAPMPVTAPAKKPVPPRAP